MQLLPPLFDGLHARRLAGCFREGGSIAEKSDQHMPFFSAVVSTELHLHAPKCPCLL